MKKYLKSIRCKWFNSQTKIQILNFDNYGEILRGEVNTIKTMHSQRDEINFEGFSVFVYYQLVIGIYFIFTML